MSYRNPYGSQLYIQSSLLSQKVSELDPYFKEIALMGADEKIAFAICYTIIEKDILNKPIEKMDIKQLLEEIIMPLLQRIGQARYKCDPLTNLGMKVGKDSISRNFDDIS